MDNLTFWQFIYEHSGSFVGIIISIIAILFFFVKFFLGREDKVKDDYKQFIEKHYQAFERIIENLNKISIKLDVHDKEHFDIMNKIDRISEKLK